MGRDLEISNTLFRSNKHYEGPNKDMGGIALNNLNLSEKVFFRDSKFNLGFSRRIVSQLEFYIDSTKQMFI
jgi:hypothetical protein